MQISLIARYDQRIPRYTSYPTAPQFVPAVNGAVYAEWLAALPAGMPLSLYLHVPFCAELCHYCGCHTAVSRKYAPIASYVEVLEREIALVAQRLGARRTVAHVHWGGGTPTILSPADLTRLFAALRAAFDFRADAEIAVEIDPRTITEDHVRALAEAGLNRASLGVQDFDPDVQLAINRVQPFEVTERVVRWLRGIGVTGINFDLMYGLPLQTVESVQATVAKALTLEPDRISLFGYAHVPWMKKHQMLMPESKLPDTQARVRQMEAATAALERAGYVAIGLDHFARAGDDMARQLAEGTLHRNFQGYTTDAEQALIGFGTSAISSLPQGYVQNVSATVLYRDAIRAGNLASIRGVAVTDEDRLRRAIIERLMCDLSVDVAAVAKEHGVAPSHFDAALTRAQPLQEDGIVVCEGYRLTVPAPMRQFVRHVAALFDAYLPVASEKAEGRYSRAL